MAATKTKTAKTKAKAKKNVKKPVVKKVKVVKAKKETKKTSQKIVKAPAKDKRYFEAVGRRKKSVARVRLFTIKPFDGEEGRIKINEKFYKEYFPSPEWQQVVESPLRRLKSLNRFEMVIKVSGGGLRGQAEAIRHGIARSLVDFNQDFRKKLRRGGFLTRDPRKKERKKFGLKKARRAPQWSKR